MELAYILAIIIFIGWGTGDLFTVYAARKISAIQTTLVIFILSFLFTSLLIPFVPHNFNLYTPTLLVLNIVLGIIYMVGNIYITEAFKRSSASLVGVIVQSFPAIVLVLSAIIYKDHITPLQYVVIALIFFGVFLCSINISELRKTKTKIDTGTKYAIVGMICIAFFFTFSRPLIITVGWFLPNYIATLCFPLIFFFMGKEKVTRKIYDLKILGACFMVALLIRGADAALNLGLSLKNASSIVVPIGGSAPILFFIISYFVYKDRLSKQQLGGIVLTLIGIVLLTLIPKP